MLNVDRMKVSLQQLQPVDAEAALGETTMAEASLHHPVSW